MPTRFVFALITVAILFLASDARAQNRVAPGYTDIGFSVADASADDAGLAYGFRAERLLRQMPSLGNGTLGVNLGISFSTYGFGLGNKWLFVPVGLSATYHFSSDSSRFDPFVALGGGYRFVECVQYLGVFADCSGEHGKAFGIARVGAKLFVSERAGFWVDGGLGSSYVSGGFLLRLK